MKLSIRLSIAVAALATGMSLGCANANFTSSKGSNGVNNPNGGSGNPDDANGTVNQPCTDQLQQLTIPVKLLFMVDTSGSNVNNDPGTDPNKVVRGQSIQEFFNLYKNKTNFNWAFQHFSGSTATPLFAGFSNATAMQQAINSFFNISDNGQTPYMAALNLIQSTLTGDTARTQQTKWAVVFMSDGMPNPSVDQNTLNNKVTQIIGTIPGQVSFNTVYYGPSDAAAAARLQGMATAGGGKFLNTNQAQRTFPIQDVITVPGTACK